MASSSVCTTVLPSVVLTSLQPCSSDRAEQLLHVPVVSSVPRKKESWTLVQHRHICRRKDLPRMVSHPELKQLFCTADAVCFDVDSTVIREEGIDELARFCGVEDAVSEMELVSRLQERNVQVFLISGGFRSIVEHVAAKLNIPAANVFANRLKFYFNGEYAGFDETQPTADSGGKGKVIKFLKEKFHFKKIIMIGDGATDMEACPPADVFIGFGGNVIRQQVKDNARWYITDFVELLGDLEE
nr:phosphoserine phosphatase isoform X3 [Marmota flaviventris]